MSPNDVDLPAKRCPRCRSEKVYRSHRRVALDHILYTLGAEIRRCRDCRCRHASFVRFSIPMGEPQSMAGAWTGIVVMASGFLACLLFVLWIIRRFSDLSG